MFGTNGLIVFISFRLSLFQMSGHTVDSTILDRMQLGDCREALVDVTAKFRDLTFDRNEYTCLKFLILLNPGWLKIRYVTSRHTCHHSSEHYENVNF